MAFEWQRRLARLRTGHRPTFPTLTRCLVTALGLSLLPSGCASPPTKFALSCWANVKTVKNKSVSWATVYPMYIVNSDTQTVDVFDQRTKQIKPICDGFKDCVVSVPPDTISVQIQNALDTMTYTVNRSDLSYSTASTHFSPDDPINSEGHGMCAPAALPSADGSS